MLSILGASVEGQKEHMHDVVGTPCCHWGSTWPAMEEVARAQLLVIALLVLSDHPLIYHVHFLFSCVSESQWFRDQGSGMGVPQLDTLDRPPELMFLC